MIKTRLLWISTVVASHSLFANPEGLVRGQAVINTPQKHQMEIHLSDDRAILDWNTFSINSAETTKFIQNGPHAAVLNRVLENSPSILQGNLEANGCVYLLNPHGILISKDAMIQTAGFIATTLCIKDADFINQMDLLFEGDSKESVVNLGTILTTTGDIALLAYRVENEGTLSAPQGTVSLASGNAFLLQTKDCHRVLIRPSIGVSNSEAKYEEGITNTGLIQAIAIELQANGSAYEMAICQDGIIEASHFLEKDGRILLSAENGAISLQGKLMAESGHVEIDGERISLMSSSLIDVSGDFQAGSVRIGKGAENVYFQRGATIDANARVAGPGGNVYLLSNGVLGVFGDINARAGSLAGDGGFVELSSPHFEFHGAVDRSSPSGKGGLLYIDPCDINITNAGATDGTFPGGIYSPTMATNNINITDIDAALTTGPVIIDTTNGAGGPNGGRLTLVDDFLYNQSNDLTLIADEELRITARLENSGTGSINLQGITGVTITNAGAPSSVVTTTGNITIGNFRSPAAPTGAITVLGGNTVANSIAEIRTDSGAISLTGDSVTLKGGSNTDCYSLISRTASTKGMIQIISTSGDLTVQGGGSTGSFAQIGGPSGTVNTDISIAVTGNLLVEGSAIDGCYAQIGLGNLTPISGTLIGDIDIAVTGTSTIQGGLGTDAYAQIGHRGGDTATNVNISGNINFAIVNNGNLTILGGDGIRSYALLGHGTDSYGIGDTWTSDISAAIGGILTVSGGIGNGSSAAIGFLALDTAGTSAGPLNINANTLSVAVQGTGMSNIIGGSGTPASAYIGSLVGGGLGNAVAIDSFMVNFTDGLTITGSPSSAQALAGIAMDAATGSSATSNLVLAVGGNLILNGGSTGLPVQIANINQPLLAPFIFTSNISARSLTLNANGSGAFIFSGGPLTMNIAQIITGTSSATDSVAIASRNTMDVFAGNNIIMINNGNFAGFFINDGPARIESQANIALISGARINHVGSTGTLDVIAGMSLFIGNNSQINYAPKNGMVNLVVDNLFPTAPGIGSGFFQMRPQGSVNALSSEIRIFTATQGLNIIEGTLNGALFTPGTLYADIPPEKWGVYYFDSFFYAGEQFTIFYKDSVQTITPPAIVERALAITTEQLRDLHPYNEYLGWPLHYHAEVASTYTDAQPRSIRYYLRKKERNESQPKIDPLVLFKDRDRV